MIKKTIIIFINHLEKKIRTDVRYVLKGFFWLGSGHIVSMLTGLATSVAFANLLAPETYGNFRYALSLLPFLEITTLAGLNNSFAISASKGLEGDFYNILKTRIKWGLLGAFGGLFLSFYYYLNGNKELSLLIVIMAIFVPLLNTPTIYGGLLLGRKKFKVISVINSIFSVVYTITTVATIFFFKEVIILLLSYLVVNTLIRFGLLFYVVKTNPPNNNKDEKAISYGKKISVLEIINIISSSLDNVLIFHYLGAVELAIYSFVKKVPENIKFIPRFITDLSTPKFSSNNIGDPFVKKEVLRKTIIFYSGIAGIVVFYIILAPFIFKTLFGPYKEYAYLSQLYAISFALNFGGLFLNFVETNRKVKSVVSMHIITSSITIVVVFLSLKFYGLTGLVLGYSGVRFINSWIRYLYFRKATS